MTETTKPEPVKPSEPSMGMAELATDPIQEAARDVSGINSPDTPGKSAPKSPVDPGRKKSGKYWSPDDFKGHPFAKKINTMMDKLDPIDGESPASEYEVGEAYVATAAEFTSSDVEIHPGYIALFNTMLFGGTVAAHWFEHRATSPGNGQKGGGKQAPVKEVPDFGSLSK